MTLIFSVRELRPGEVDLFVSGHLGTKRQSWDPGAVSILSRVPGFLPILSSPVPVGKAWARDSGRS